VLQLEDELLPDQDEEFLEALADPDHEDHLRMKEWVGRPFDQGAFSLAETNQRLQKMLRLRKRR